MPSPKPKPIKTPFQQTNAFTPQSIAGTPEAREYLDVPVDVDPGVAQRTDNARQEVEDRWNSSFNAGTPGFVRDLAMGKEMRDVNARGAQESQQANYMTNALKLQRRERLLPQILQTGSSGFGTQVVQPEPGFWHKAGLSLIGGAANAGRMALGGF